MSMLVSIESPFGKELWKWEHHEGEGHPQDSSIRGMRPNGYKPYPAMLYKMTQKNPWKYESTTVKDEVEQRWAEGQGFVPGGLAKAAEAFDANQQAVALAAAERNYSDRHLSEKAQAEVHEAESASSRHLGEIPETPIRRRQLKTTDPA